MKKKLGVIRRKDTGAAGTDRGWLSSTDEQHSLTEKRRRGLLSV